MKPNDPKAAMIQALKGASSATRRRRSARIFGEIAANTPLDGCEDPAFKKLTATLREWFPKAQPLLPHQLNIMQKIKLPLRSQLKPPHLI